MQKFIVFLRACSVLWWLSWFCRCYTTFIRKQLQIISSFKIKI